MLEKTIGIVLTKRTGKEIEGYLAKYRIKSKKEQDTLMEVEVEIIKHYFKMSTLKKKILTVEEDTSIFIAKEIGKKLKEIGYRTIILVFGEEEIPI